VAAALTGARTAWRSLNAPTRFAIAAAGLLGTALAVHAAMPKVTVTMTSLRDPADPMSSLFVVKNDGQFAVYDVTFACKPIEMTGPGYNVRFEDAYVHAPSIRTLPSGREHTETCWRGFILTQDGPFQDYAETEILVGYRPAPWLPRTKRLFRFGTTLNSSKAIEWVPLVREDGEPYSRMPHDPPALD